MSFRTRAIHQPDSELDLHCKFGSEWVQFRSIVRRAGEATMGVEFLNVSPLARTKLIEFLNLKTAAATA